MLVHTVVWIAAVVSELLFSFALFYGIFYSERLSRSNAAGLVLGIILSAVVLGGLGAPAAAAIL